MGNDIEKARREAEELVAYFYRALPCNVETDARNTAPACQETAFRQIEAKEKEFQANLSQARSAGNPYFTQKWDFALQALHQRKLFHQGGASGEADAVSFIAKNRSSDDFNRQLAELKASLGAINAKILLQLKEERATDADTIEMSRLSTLVKILEAYQRTHSLIPL